MSRPLVSVVLATFNRAHLLARSLECYARSEGLDVTKDLELVVIDDHSTDDGRTASVVRVECGCANIRYQIITPGPKERGSWRDCGAVLNYGIRASSGQHIILTHPEVMPGKRSVAKLVEQLDQYDGDRWREEGRIDLKCKPGLYAACKVYYLSPRSQELIDTVAWREQGVLALRQIPGFYDPAPGGNPDYHPHVTDLVARPGYRIKTWDSWVFGAASRETWKRLGGMLESQKWGSVDILFNDRRKRVGMAEWTCPDDDSIVAHQNHDLPGNVPTPRDEAAWRKECEDYPREAAKLVYPAIDYLGWGG